MDGFSIRNDRQPIKSKFPLSSVNNASSRMGWIIETQTTDQSEAQAWQFHCLCTGLMRDLLTFPIGAVNFCLSMHFQDLLSVWSEQLPAKCVCQLRQSPLPLCCPKKIKREEPHPPFHSPLETPPPQPPNVPSTPHIPPPNLFISF